MHAAAEADAATRSLQAAAVLHAKLLAGLWAGVCQAPGSFSWCPGGGSSSSLHDIRRSAAFIIFMPSNGGTHTPAELMALVQHCAADASVDAAR